MMIVGCDFHPGWQQVAVFDSETGEIKELNPNAVGSIRGWPIATFGGVSASYEPYNFLMMSSHDKSTLIRSMEKHLGRELTAAERKLLALAEDLTHQEEREPPPESKARSASD